MVSFSFLFFRELLWRFWHLGPARQGFRRYELSARVPAPKSPRIREKFEDHVYLPYPPPAGGEGLFLALGDAATLPADPLQKQAEGAVPSPRLRQHARGRRNSSRLALRVVAHHFVIIPQLAAPRV